MGYFPPKTFTLTEEHVALLRASGTRWDDNEFGAAAIDSKRPYGNSNVINDVHRVLTGEDLHGETERLTEEQREHYATLRDVRARRLRGRSVFGSVASIRPQPLGIEQRGIDR